MTRLGKARCGTPSGYNRHLADGEKPCDACARSKQEYDHRLRLADGKARASRQLARAQNRATTTLRKNHPEEWAALYAAAKAEVLSEDEASDD